MPQRTVDTVIVEPHGLLREGLVSLIAHFPYRVAGSYNSVDQIPPSVFAETNQQLIILGEQGADNAIADAEHIRRTWPDCKIVLLTERLSAQDFQKLITSTIDGCIPLYVSHDVLTRTLDLVMTENTRIVVMADQALSKTGARVEPISGRTKGVPNGTHSMSADAPGMLHVAQWDALPTASTGRLSTAGTRTAVSRS
jgi:two-component system, NarL family, nitrate/nitrite response regulator NarL